MFHLRVMVRAVWRKKATTSSSKWSVQVGNPESDCRPTIFPRWQALWPLPRLPYRVFVCLHSPQNNNGALKRALVMIENLRRQLISEKQLPLFIDWLQPLHPPCSKDNRTNLVAGHRFFSLELKADSHIHLSRRICEFWGIELLWKSNYRTLIVDDNHGRTS